MDKTVMTLVYPRRGTQVLLGLKKLRIGNGKFGGFGGRVEQGESIKSAAVRELKEECGITVEIGDLSESGLLKVCDQKYPELGTLMVHIFTTDDWSGEPQNTKEMTPCWFDINELPWDRLRKSDWLWLEDVLCGKIVEAEISYDKNEIMTKCHISPPVDRQN